MSEEDNVLIARIIEPAPLIIPKLEELDFYHLPFANDWMPWSIYTSDEDSPKMRDLKEKVTLYNAAIRAIKNTPGLFDSWVESGLVLTKEQVSANWGTEIAETIFAVQPSLFVPAIRVSDNTITPYEKGSPKYEVDVPLVGKIRLKFQGYNYIEYEWARNTQYELSWDFSNDDRDFTYDLWYSLSSYIPDSYDDDGNPTDYPDFQHYECWDQGRCSMDEPDSRLLGCMFVLAGSGYAHFYTVKPETPDPLWNETDREDGTVELMVLDNSFSDNPEVEAQLRQEMENY